MFRTRLLSGIVLVILAVLTLSLGGVWLLGALGLISLIAYRELTKALLCATDEKKLNTLEIAGLNEIFMNPQFLQLLCKLEGLKAQETNFELYRKTVFESISLLQELSHGIRL